MHLSWILGCIEHQAVCSESKLTQQLPDQLYNIYTDDDDDEIYYYYDLSIS